MNRQPYEFTKLIQCWKSLPRDPGKAPLKTTFSPVNVSSLMPFLFLIERVKKGDLVVRLLGSELEQTLGCAGGDHRVFDAMMRKDWAFYDRFVQNCSDYICAGRLLRSVRMSDGLIKDVESLHVPLADKYGDVRFMLGVMTARTNRDASSRKCLKATKSTILNYQYVDIGCGLPPVEGIVKAAEKTTKSPAQAGTEKTAREPLLSSGEHASTYVS